MTPEVTLLRPATHGSQACGRLYGFQNEEAQISWLSAQIFAAPNSQNIENSFVERTFFLLLFSSPTNKNTEKVTSKKTPQFFGDFRWWKKSHLPTKTCQLDGTPNLDVGNDMDWIHVTWWRLLVIDGWKSKKRGVSSKLEGLFHGKPY